MTDRPRAAELSPDPLLPPQTTATMEGYEQDCGLLRVQALSYGEAMMDRVDAALAVASRHFDRIHEGSLPLVPAVAREIEASIRRARSILAGANQ